MRLNLCAVWLLACTITLFYANVAGVLVATALMQAAFWLTASREDKEEGS